MPRSTYQLRDTLLFVKLRGLCSRLEDGALDVADDDAALLAFPHRRPQQRLEHLGAGLHDELVHLHTHVGGVHRHQAYCCTCTIHQGERTQLHTHTETECIHWCTCKTCRDRLVVYLSKTLTVHVRQGNRIRHGSVMLCRALQAVERTGRMEDNVSRLCPLT